MIENVLQQLAEETEATHQSLKTQLSKLRTGRAHIAMLDGVRVNYYGTPTPLGQCASLSVADNRMLLVKPWDKNLIREIEKSILEANLGIMPQNDGDTIRLLVPSPSEERRLDLVKQSKELGEKTRIGLRNHRRDANDLLKELEKDKKISQDDLKRALERVQDCIDKASVDIDKVLAVKEEEILRI